MSQSVGREDYSDLPDEMRTARRWLAWRAVQSNPNQKPRKVPYYTTGEPRSGTLDGAEDVARLASFDQAVAVLQTGEYAGLGFALGPDGGGGCWQGIDLDDVEARPGLRFIADGLPGYVERSPSGQGLHAIGYGAPFRPLGPNSTGIEAYAGGRFFTVTGESVVTSETALTGPIDLGDFIRNRLVALHGQTAQRALPAPTSPRDLARLVPDLRSALNFLRADDRAEWIAIGMALKVLGEQGRELWLTWSQQSEKFDTVVAAHVWDGLTPERTGPRAVFAKAQAAGWINPRKAPPQASHSSSSEQICAPEFSDEALALEFADRHAARLQWVQATGKWMFYNGRYWQPDETLLAFSYARQICREAADRCNKDHLKKALAAAKTVAAVERLARADRRLAATVDQWDADPFALNTESGVIDLRTGRASPHDPADFMTKITAVAPGGDCPLWRDVIDRVFAGDAALIAFVQRMLGYMLSGDISVQAVFFAFGRGANGKSLLFNTVAAILGGYHRLAAIETFIASDRDRHPTEIAWLSGARMVTANETEEGRRWSESKLKAMTGDDELVGRFVARDFFRFKRQFKLLIVGNHKPGLRSVDEAIRRRFRLIPFAVTIPQEERDERLPDKLRDEWPGILAWMVQGCLDWQRYGLEPPEAVRMATEQYLQAEDALASWIDERCEVSPAYWASSHDLFADWTAWAEAAREPVRSRKEFADKLAAHGFEDKRRKARGYLGLRLNSARSGE
jgi:putative DNA primase/helicase